MFTYQDSRPQQGRPIAAAHVETKCCDAASRKRTSRTKSRFHRFTVPITENYRHSQPSQATQYNGVTPWRSSTAAECFYPSAPASLNKMLNGFGCQVPIEMVRRKYLNNIVEQGHRFIKRRTRPMLGFKSFVSASATLAGIEVAHMIRKRQFIPGLWPFQQFRELLA